MNIHHEIAMHILFCYRISCSVQLAWKVNNVDLIVWGYQLDFEYNKASAKVRVGTPAGRLS